MRCSRCGATHVDGIRDHHPACPFRRPGNVLAEHPDLIDWEADMEFWFGEAWSGPVERKRVGRR